jgi:hypothetical protein
VPEPLAWRERVQLSDGTQILVERQERISRSSESGGPSSFEVFEAGLKVDASTPAAGFLPLRTSEFLMILDRDTSGVWYAITVIDMCPRAQAEALSGRPYLEYRLEQGVWSRRQVSAARIGEKANLLVNKLGTDQGRLVVPDIVRDFFISTALHVI